MLIAACPTLGSQTPIKRKKENELGTVVYEINSTRKRHEYNAVDKSHRREAKKEKSDIKWSTLPNFNYPRRKQLQSILG